MLIKSPVLSELSKTPIPNTQAMSNLQAGPCWKVVPSLVKHPSTHPIEATFMVLHLNISPWMLLVSSFHSVQTLLHWNEFYKDWIALCQLFSFQPQITLTESTSIPSNYLLFWMLKMLFFNFHGFYGPVNSPLSLHWFVILFPLPGLVIKLLHTLGHPYTGIE